MEEAIIQSIREAMTRGMQVATGCTEPVAIALAGATAYAYTSGEIESIHLYASGNVIKNAFVVGIPGTSFTGPKYAVALGALCGDPSKQLALLEHMDPEQVKKAVALVEAGKVSLDHSDRQEKLFIEVMLKTAADVVIVRVSGAHTNVESIIKNGEAVYQRACGVPTTGKEGPFTFSLADVFEFCTTAPLSEFEVVEQAITLNSAIAEEGR